MIKNSRVTTIYVVRHGESESNVYARENPGKPASHFGEFGSSLTQKGRDQVYQLAKRLKNVPASAILSSDLNRAKETAEIIAQDHNLPVITNSTIRERFFGEHMSSVQKREIEKAMEDLDEEGKFAFKYFPNGESGLDVVNRFKKFLEKIIETYKNKTVIVVCHGYIMRSFLIHEHYAKYDELLGGSIKNAGYFVVKTNGKTFRIVDKHGITRRKGLDDEE
jgi:broad specificity phosphatase PhoE